MLELGKNQVFVMTYSVFVHVIQEKLLKMNQVNLLVVDDCHNVMNDEVLKKILVIYEKSLIITSSYPRVLGLTASIVNNMCKPIELSQLIIFLEKEMKSSIQTSNNILSALQ